jgi:pimeloyl-ACP methyl ester carboxylesterase
MSTTRTESKTLAPLHQIFDDRWGAGESLRLRVPSMWGDPQAREFLGRLEHTAGSPGTMRAFTDSLIDIDVRAVFPTISVPTLLIHATDHMTDARFVERDGEHARFDLDQFVGEIESLRVSRRSRARARSSCRALSPTSPPGRASPSRTRATTSSQAFPGAGVFSP